MTYQAAVGDIPKTAGNIFWLASYPKSGNTWVRLFIRALLDPDNCSVDINNIYVGEIASSRDWVQSAVDFDIEELTHDEIDRLRPAAYQWLSDQPAETRYHKVHDAYGYLSGGEPLFPISSIKGVLYLVRNPLDVAISYSHHLQSSLDQAIEELNNQNSYFADKTHKLSIQLRQKLGSWSDHVRSWRLCPKHLIKFVRYEDMVTNSVEVFCEIAEFLQLPSSQQSVARALTVCSFEQLREQEKTNGFREKPQAMPAFFRKGEVGQWRTELSAAQVQRVVSAHYEVMASLGYLDSSELYTRSV